MIELDAAKPSADDDPADGSDVRSVEVDPMDLSPAVRRCHRLLRFWFVLMP